MKKILFDYCCIFFFVSTIKSSRDDIYFLVSTTGFSSYSYRFMAIHPHHLGEKTPLCQSKQHADGVLSRKIICDRFLETSNY